MVYFIWGKYCRGDHKSLSSRRIGDALRSNYKCVGDELIVLRLLRTCQLRTVRAYNNAFRKVLRNIRSFKVLVKKCAV